MNDACPLAPIFALSSLTLTRTFLFPFFIFSPLPLGHLSLSYIPAGGSASGGLGWGGRHGLQ